MGIIDSAKKALGIGITNKETKWFNADGTPKTITSARRTIGGGGISATKRNEKALKEYWGYYSNDGTVFSSINTIAWNTIMVGYHLTSEDEEAKKLIQSKFDEIDLDGILLDNVIYALVYGDSFIEKVKGKKKPEKKSMQDGGAEPKKPKGYISYLKTVDPITMVINTDQYGNEDSYQQKIQGRLQPTKLTNEEIIHLKFFPQSNTPYGISLIGPSQSTIDRMIGVDEALYKATIRHGTPKFVTTVGTPDEIPPKAVYDKIKSDLEDINYNNEFTVPGPVKIDTIDERGVPGVEEYSSIFQKKAIVGLMCPEESLGMSTRGSTEACNDERTEVLTLNGWKKYWELINDDRIATYNPETKEIEYHKSLEPVDKYIYDHDGPMIRIESENNDMLVTPNHRMYANKSHYTSKEDWKFYLAEELNTNKNNKFGIKSSIVPCNTTWQLELNEFEKKIIDKSGIKSLMKFIGYFVSEGSINRDSPYCRFSQKKLESSIRIKEMIDEFSLKFNYTFTDERGYEFRRYDYELWNYLKNFGDNCYNRRIPRRIILQNPKNLEILLDAAIDGDGTRVSKNCHEYTSCSEELVDNIQEIALRCGYKTKKYFSPSRRDTRIGMYRVTILDNDNDYSTLLPKRNITEVHYEGKVFSLNVPNHIYITRRNGKIAIQGNTAKVREIMFERFIQSLQHKLSTKLRVELINPILLENGHEENTVYMKFRSITTADEEGFAKWYGNLLRGFQFTKQKPVTINEIRDSFHLPPIEGGDDITWGGQVGNVGGAGGVDNEEEEEEEEIEVPKPGPSPQATSD